MEASAATPTSQTATTSPPALAGLRRQFLAMDVWIISFMLLVIGWSLLSLVVPQARLYPYEPRYAWAELPAFSLIGQFVIMINAN